MKKILAFLLAALLLTTSACAANETGYRDVPADAWYAEAVQSLREAGLMNGVGGDRFDPDGVFTRAQLATVLYRIAGSPAVSGEDGFTDTAAGAWYADAVLWASQNGVVNGYGDGKFGTNDAATQEQMAVMLWRNAGSYVLDASYADANGVENAASDWAFDAVRWARVDGLLTDAIPFTPKAPANRAQVAGMINRYLKLLEQFSSADAVSGATPKTEEEPQQIVLTVAGRTLSVAWADNSSVDALRELLKKGDVTLDMSDYGGFEKGAPLPQTLPENNEQMQTDAGDVILYQGKQFVIYYDTNSWSLTPLGKITGIDKAELRELLGDGNVTAVLSLHGVPAAEKKILVAYFSCTGTTERIAGYIADELQADVRQILPQTPYTSDDLNYGDSSSRATREQNDPAARPALRDAAESVADYDVIFLGYPIWWGQAPKILYTFVESCDLAGKTIVPFCTSGSSGIGTSAENLSASAPDAVWLPGNRFGAGASRDTVAAWLQGLSVLSNS
ncbi:MAG: S-layer homology domain-containing protein [Oscillospiraceae bacterium]|nr:S-layer homology domain-containing protein [Oscillospiraceae bacterium]